MGPRVDADADSVMGTGGNWNKFQGYYCQEKCSLKNQHLMKISRDIHI